MQLNMISGKSPLAAAIRYALTRMERLRPYLDHGKRCANPVRLSA
jgi:hypothetical protein